MSLSAGSERSGSWCSATCVKRVADLVLYRAGDGAGGVVHGADRAARGDNARTGWDDDGRGDAEGAAEESAVQGQLSPRGKVLACN